MEASQAEGIISVEFFLKGSCVPANLVVISVGPFRVELFLQLVRPSLTTHYNYKMLSF